MSLTTMFFLLIAALALTATASFAQSSHDAAEYFVYISGSPKEKPGAISLYRLNVASGSLAAEGTVAELHDPNFLAVSPQHAFLYASCNPKVGALAAFSIDAQTGKLTALNQEPSAGHRAVHVSIDPSGRTALVANYVGNTVAALAIHPDGSLEAATPEGIRTHIGSGPNASRQPHPFPHSIYPDPTGHFAYSCDLGADKIYCYKLDAAHATLTPNDPPVVATPPGSGPRHLAFSPDRKAVYVITEMGNTLLAYHFDAGTGSLTHFQTISCLPPNTPNHDQQTGGEVQIHPNGKFLYASNRGPHSSITLFAIDAATGTLAYVADTLSGGNHPRFFTLDPTGSLLLAANLFSDNVAIFRIDPSSGRLTSAGSPLAVPAPMCVVFVPIR